MSADKDSYTVPPFGIIINKNNPDHNIINGNYLSFGKDGLLKHELTHWDQFRKNGWLLFKLKYIYYNSKYGYFNNPFEKEAYMAADQWKYIPDKLKII